MKYILLSIVFLVTLNAAASDYEKRMLAAIKELERCKTSEQFSQLSKSFMDISQTHTEEWLPKYYSAHCLVVSSIILNEEHKERKDEILDRAEKLVDDLVEYHEDEVEVIVLESLFYSARLMVNPAMRGMKYGMLSTKSSNKAVELDPTNPRAQFMRIRNEMGKAEFLGKDTQQYCMEAQSTLTAFNAYKPESLLHPAWGKTELREIIASCK